MIKIQGIRYTLSDCRSKGELLLNQLNDDIKNEEWINEINNSIIF